MKVFGCVAIAALCLSTEAQNMGSAKVSDWVLRFDGIGTVKVGMTLPQLNAAIGEKFSTPADKDEQSCFYLEPAKHPDTGIMMLDGHVARVDVFAPDGETARTATEKGVRIGDSEATVRKIYGDSAEVTPHHYTDGHYVTVEAGRFGLRFETENNKVTSFYAGTREAIALVEGCS